MVLTIVLAASAVIAALDQLFKYLIVQNLADSGSVSVIENILSFTYIENRGIAFGMFQGKLWLFSAVTIVLIGVFIWLIASRRFSGKLFCTSAALLIGGGIGNLIDRIFRGFVVDYLSLSFFSPVCNFADYCITAGAVLLAVSLLMQSGTFRKPRTPQENTSSEDDSANGETHED